MQARLRNAHREVAAVEVLDRRRAQHAARSSPRPLRTAARRSAPRGRGGETPPRTCSPTRATPPTCGRYVLVNITIFTARSPRARRRAGAGSVPRSSIGSTGEWSLARVDVVQLAETGDFDVDRAADRPRQWRVDRQRRLASPVARRTVTGPHGVSVGPNDKSSSAFEPFGEQAGADDQPVAFLADEAVADHHHPLGRGPAVLAVAHAAAAGLRMDGLGPLAGGRGERGRPLRSSSRYRGSPARSSVWAMSSVR